jgi:hypothetical protein
MCAVAQADLLSHRHDRAALFADPRGLRRNSALRRRLDRRQRQLLGAPRDVAAAATQPGTVGRGLCWRRYRRVLCRWQPRSVRALDAARRALPVRAGELGQGLRVERAVGLGRGCRAHQSASDRATLSSAALSLHSVRGGSPHRRADFAPAVLPLPQRHGDAHTEDGGRRTDGRAFVLRPSSSVFRRLSAFIVGRCLQHLRHIQPAGALGVGGVDRGL